MQFHQKSLSEIYKDLETNPEKGLSKDKIEQKLKTFGYNKLPEEEKESIWDKIKEQFEDILVRILLAAAFFSFIASYFGQQDEHSLPAWIEPCVIITILILNGIVGVYQDYDAENAIDALKSLQSSQALVLRDGEWIKIQSTDLVPGDICKIQIGDKVPADMRLIQLESTILRVDQSIFTGETKPTNKEVSQIQKNDAVIIEKSNMVFSGSLVVQGVSMGVVCNTGANTEIGQIQNQVKEAQNDKETDSPLQQKLDEFGEKLAQLIAWVCLVIWLINFNNFFDDSFGHWFYGAIYYFKIAVALAVAAIPEGLPAVITTCLALGSRRMAKQNAIVRKLNSVETLGCTTVICSDKTGTLTTNQMCVKNLLLVEDQDPQKLKNFVVEGATYSIKGEVSEMDKFCQQDIPQNLKQLTEIIAVCNDSFLMLDDKQNVVPAGLPTEAALKVLNEKIGFYDSKFKRQQNGSIEQYNQQILKNQKKEVILEFTRERRAMSVVSNGKMLIKGAPDYILENSSQILLKNGIVQPLKKEHKAQILNQITQQAKQGLRTLAFSYKGSIGDLDGYNGQKNHMAHSLLQNQANFVDLENDQIFVGAVSLQDPPRPGVAQAIQTCQIAGIKVFMITGDVKETAEQIAKQVGIIKTVQDNSFSGTEFFKLPEQKQLQILQNEDGLVFSRTEPAHKRQLVQRLSELKHVVAMTGDGVNDAPALKQAHIGIAMGIAGTEVAKEASVMILADDNFNTIVLAVQEGRAIYANMKAFIRYMISSNIGEVMSIFIASFLGIPDGFNSIQLLWVNLVTDGLPATALSFNPADPDVMKKKPRKSDDALINQWTMIRFIIIGTYVGFATVGIFVYWYCFYDWNQDGHQLVKLFELRNWTKCEEWKDFKVTNYRDFDFSKDPCSYFDGYGKRKASTLSLSVLVLIEMLNAVNALSEDSSIFKVGLFSNPWLIIACFMSLALHNMIIYVPQLAIIFSLTSLDLNDWILVVMFSLPVIIIDEVIFILQKILKIVSKFINYDTKLVNKKNQ